VFAWLNPIALAGLIAVAGPIAVHLLRRQRAARRPFPSLRFVLAASTAAVRLRLPSDLWLLLLRVAIVAGAATALAQPLLVTPARRASWDARVSRAIVVDTSASMANAAGPATEAAAAEAQGTAFSVRVAADHLQLGLRRAVDALEATPPSRREIVVISDFQNGALTAEDLQVVPRAFGLRFTTVGGPPLESEFHGDIALGAPGIEPRTLRIRPTAETTSVLVSPAEAPSAGLRLIDAGSAGDVLLRAVARSGAPAGSASEPIAIAFTQRNVTTPTNPSPWMLRTLVAMRRDRSLVEAAREHRRAGQALASSALVVARDASGAPVVAAAPQGNELVLIVAAAPADYLAAATLRSALLARRGRPDWGEHEVGQIPARQLADWTREPGPFVTTGRPSDSMSPGDSRWVWVTVLALLGIEALVRRKRSTREPSDLTAAAGHADAA
jgi:hypothetical protein